MAGSSHEPPPPGIPRPVATLELLGLKCPENATRATLKLDTLDEGEVLALFVDDGETLTTMIPNLADEGYPVLFKRRLDNGHWEVWVAA